MAAILLNWTNERFLHAVMQGRVAARSSKLHDVMVIAEKEGLLRGARTQVVRGRMTRAKSAPELTRTRT